MFKAVRVHRISGAHNSRSKSCELLLAFSYCALLPAILQQHRTATAQSSLNGPATGPTRGFFACRVAIKLPSTATERVATLATKLVEIDAQRLAGFVDKSELGGVISVGGVIQFLGYRGQLTKPALTAGQNWTRARTRVDLAACLKASLTEA